MLISLYKLTFFVLLLFPVCSFSQTRLVMDEWYKYTAKYTGYMHYVVHEDSSHYYISSDIKLKVEDEVIFFNVQSVNHKDKYLTVKELSMKTNGEGGSIVYDIHGTVTRQGDSLFWDFSGENVRRRQKKTKYPTVNFFDTFFLLTTLDYSQKGRLLEYNSMETDELHYKENEYIDYVEDSVMVVDDREVRVRKVTINGDAIGESTFWLDENNRLIKISIDNYKDQERCKKEDIDFNIFN